ncbi:unnamed protein product, partial [Symbiodinium necroappetens]
VLFTMAFLAALGPRAARTLAPVARGSVQVNRCFLSGSAVGLQARGAPRFAVAARSFGSSAKVAVIQDQQIPKDEEILPAVAGCKSHIPVLDHVSAISHSSPCKVPQNAKPSM